MNKLMLAALLVLGQVQPGLTGKKTYDTGKPKPWVLVFTPLHSGLMISTGSVWPTSDTTNNANILDYSKGACDPCPSMFGATVMTFEKDTDALTWLSGHRVDKAWLYMTTATYDVAQTDQSYKVELTRR